MARRSAVRNRSGKVKVGTLIWLIVIAIPVYFAIQFGGVYIRKYKLEDVVNQELSYAGQRADDAIRQRLVAEIAAMDLPPAAASRLQFSRVESPRALQLSISYVETINLLFTKKPLRVSLQKRRPF